MSEIFESKLNEIGITLNDEQKEMFRVYSAFEQKTPVQKFAALRKYKLYIE